MMSGDDVLTMPAARRIEVVTVAGRRRWSAEAKAQIVAESYDTSVGEVAERYSLAKTQVFTWRREARRATGQLGFAPVVVEDGIASETGVIEVRLGDAMMRIPPGADPRMAAAVLSVLKRAR